MALDKSLSRTDPTRRNLGNLAQDIVATIARRERLPIMSIQHLTARLQAAFPKYKTMNPHTLRRDVSALVDFAGRMQRLSDLRADLSGGLSFDEAVATAQRKALDQKQVKVRKTLLRIYQHQKLSNK